MDQQFNDNLGMNSQGLETPTMENTTAKGTFSSESGNIYEQEVSMDSNVSYNNNPYNTHEYNNSSNDNLNNNNNTYNFNQYNDNSYNNNPYDKNPYEENSYTENTYSENVSPQQNNYFVKPVYQVQNPYPEVDTSKDGICMASFILGIIGFFINPLYIVSILAIVFGAMGQGSLSVHAGKAKIGLILGIVSIAVQICVDLILTIFTGGVGGISCCC